MIVVQIFLKISVRQLVCRLKLTIILTLTLKRVISEMNVSLFQPYPLLLTDLIFELLCLRVLAFNLHGQRKFLARCTNVPLSIPICLYLAINACNKHIMTDVELSAVVKKRGFDVGLD